MPEQNYIRLFGPEHFLYIAILLVFAVCLFAFRTKIPKHRKAITILLPYYMMIAYGLQIKKGDRNTAFGWFTTYLAFVYFFNPLVDGNFFYLKYRPVFARWPDYVYLPAALAVTYLGFWLGERWYLFIQQKLSYRRYRTGTHRHKDRGMK